MRGKRKPDYCGNKRKNPNDKKYTESLEYTIGGNLVEFGGTPDWLVQVIHIY
jgi:hypothetical protein